MPKGTADTHTEWPASQRVGDIRSVLHFFAIARPTWNVWKDSGCPVEPDGTYDLQKILVWRLKSRSMTSQSKIDLEVEKLQIQNAAAALALREKQGELVSRREVKAKVAALFHRIRTRLEMLPAEISTLAPTAQRAEFLADSKLKIRLLLKEMESWSMEEAAAVMVDEDEEEDVDDPTES